MMLHRSVVDCRLGFVVVAAFCVTHALSQTNPAEPVSPAAASTQTGVAEPAGAAQQLFIVHLTTGSAWAKEKPAQEQAGFREHSQNLARMRNDGVLVVGARYKDSAADKGMLLIRAANVESVQAQFAGDPMIRDKLFALDIAAFQTFYEGFVTRPLRANAAPELGVNAFGWLAGCWSGRNGKSEFREHWMRPAGGLMMGMGRTMSDSKVSAYEALRIELDAGGLPLFLAKPSGQPEASFKMLKAAQASVTFENPAHDFPQRVLYQLKPDGTLHARIERVNNGKERGIDFMMRRTSCE